MLTVPHCVPWANQSDGLGCPGGLVVQACDERHVAGVLRRDGVTECTASSPPPLRLTLIPMRPPPLDYQHCTDSFPKQLLSIKTVARPRSWHFWLTGAARRGGAG